MNEKVLEALDKTTRVASECNDLESLAALLMVKAAMMMRGANEVYTAVKPIAERLLSAEQSWPAELDA